MIAVVLGDQLDLESPALEACDAVIMVEAAEESRRVRSHKARTILFFSAMRHFAASLRERGLTVHYRSIEQGHQGSLVEQILELAGSQTDAGLRMLEQEVERRFDVDFGDYFAREQAELAEGPIAHGFLRDDGGLLRVTPRGRLFVRNVCMIFDRHLREKRAATPVFSRTV